MTYNDIVKPCPFCGSDAYVWHTNYQTYIQCSESKNGNDRHLVQISADTFEKAVKEWNKRISRDTELNRVKPELNRDKTELKSECEYDHEILKAHSDGAREVLDKVRTELEEKIEMYDCPIELDGGNDAWFCEGINRAIEIIEKYRGEQ